MSFIFNRVLLLGSFFVFSIMAQAPAVAPAATAVQQQPSAKPASLPPVVAKPAVRPAAPAQAPVVNVTPVESVQAPTILEPAAPTETPALPTSEPAAETAPSEMPLSPTEMAAPVEQSVEPSVVAEPTETPAEVEEQAVPAEVSSEVAAPVTAEQPAAEVPVVPVPPQEVRKQEPKPEEVAPEDFDTSKLKEYGGNWYFKQGWWQRAEREYEKARQVMDQIFESRMEFFERQASLDRNLFDPFYQEIGFERGELQDVIDLLIDKINEERKNEGMLDINEREFLAKLQQEKTALEQLKLNFELVNKYDAAVSTAISELLKQLNQARQYEQAAWQEFKAIAEDLNDVVARARFYAVKTQHKNIKNILEYLQGSFKEYFDKLESNAKNEIELVKDGVKTLKARGIDLKEEAKKLVDEEKGERKPATTDQQTGDEMPQPGFIMRVLTAIGGVLATVWNFLLGWLYRF